MIDDINSVDKSKEKDLEVIQNVQPLNSDIPTCSNPGEANGKENEDRDKSIPTPDEENKSENELETTQLVEFVPET